MKKKMLSLGTSILLLTALLAGCGSSAAPAGSTSDETAAPAASETAVPAEATAPQLQLTDADFTVEETLLKSQNFLTDVVLVTNNAQVPARVTIDAVFQNASGTEAGKDSNSRTLSPGETLPLFLYCSPAPDENCTPALSFTYEANPSAHFITDQILLEEFRVSDNIIARITNQSDSISQTVYMAALYYDAQGNLVDFTEEVMPGPGMQLNPDSTSTRLLIHTVPYDHAKVYVQASAYDPSVDNAAAVLDFDIRQYTIDGNDYFIVTNHSQDLVWFRIEAVAKDAVGKPIEASIMDVQALKPGETQVASAFLSTKGAETETNTHFSVDTWNTTPEYSFTSDMTVENQMIHVSITNDGTAPAQMIRTTVLLFDAENNLVGVEYGYAGDEQLQPGRTLSIDVHSTVAFDHAEVYVNGRPVE